MLPVDVLSSAEHSERLSVPLRWWAQGCMFLATVWLALVVAVPEPLAWSATAAALALMALAFVSYGSASVSVRGGVLRAGRARIEGHHLGRVEALDRAATRAAAGAEADARAFLLMRPYVHRAVRVEVVDPADPTPYWLVATRHPEHLARALETIAGGRQAASG